MTLYTEQLKNTHPVSYTHLDVYKRQVQRMSDNRLPKQILRWTPYGRRRRGRSRLSWREGINWEMRDRELEEESWLERDQWKLGIG